MRSYIRWLGEATNGYGQTSRDYALNVQPIKRCSGWNFKYDSEWLNGIQVFHFLYLGHSQGWI